MIYKVPTKDVTATSKLVYLPNCNSMTQMQMCKLNGTEKSVPKWLPSVPKDITGRVAYLLLCTLACMTVVLIATEIFGMNDNLYMPVIITAVVIVCAQFAIDSYKSYVAHFNWLLSIVPAPGININDSIVFDALKLCDEEVFNEAVDLMTDGNSYMGFSIGHAINDVIDDYIQNASHAEMSFHMDSFGKDLSRDQAQLLYEATLDILKPHAEQCINTLDTYIHLYEEDRQYMYV